MTHLLVHLVEEIVIPGHVFLHNMFPFKRFMRVLKKYVHNRDRPEESISKCYGIEEVIEFCVDSIPDFKFIKVLKQILVVGNDVSYQHAKFVTRNIIYSRPHKNAKF
jgi:hypothetical protein